MKEPQQREEVQAATGRTNWTTIALIGFVVLLAAMAVFFATRGNSDQDKLTNSVVTSSTPPRQREKLCASSATYDLIKRELFRRAAEIRGSDQGAFDRLSAYAVVRMDNPVMESQDATTGAVNCSGSLSIDLPPGVAVIGGRRTLNSDVDYTVTTAADGSGPVVLLRNADAIITPLATLARVEAPPAQQPQEPPLNNGVAAPTYPAAPAQSQPTAPVITAPPAAPVSRPAPPVSPPRASVARPISARPSFDCVNAHRPGEKAVCGNAGLAALDRQMAREYARAVSLASPEQRAILRSTAHRFYDYRDRCSSNACIGDAYTGRVREIHDIIAGTWRPSR
jgi:hypothetical protein